MYVILYTYMYMYVIFFFCKKKKELKVCIHAFTKPTECLQKQSEIHYLPDSCQNLKINVLK